MYAYLFWDKIWPKMAKILQFYVLRDQNCKPVCSYLRVYVYLRAQSIHNIQGDPNQKLVFGMSITLNLNISDPLFEKPKCVWKAFIDLKNCKQTSDRSVDQCTFLKHILALPFLV